MGKSAAARAQLRALEAQFYQQFAVPGLEGGTQEGKDEENDSDSGQDEAPAAREDSDDDEVEASADDDDDDDDDDGASEAPDDNASDLDDGEDLLQAAMAPPPAKAPKTAQARRPVETVVFSETPSAPSTQPARARRNFMVRRTLTQSSKIEKINAQDAPPPAEPTDADDDEDEDQRANDRKLAELLSTSLFAPGAGKNKRKLNTTTNETLARVMELSTSDTLHAHTPGSGWGEQQLRAQELGKMPARIRAGLRRAAGERRERDIETQKELGLWNPRYQSHAQRARGTATERGTRATEPKKRLRGIGSGIGSFRHGTLHLSDADVRRIQGPKHTAPRRGKK